MTSQQLTRREMIERDIIHDEDHERNRRKLKGLYGRVADAQNRLIVTHCTGRRVLDVGAGYGNLTAALRAAGLEAIAIEVDAEKIALARQWYGVEVEAGDIHATRFPDAAFDTVIFREVINHLRLEEAIREAARLATRRIIIFQHNRIWPLRAALRLFGHHEHASYSVDGVNSLLRSAGFGHIRVRHRDVIAFPLSGGYIGRQLVPSWRWLGGLLMGLDWAAAGFVNALRLGRWCCFRRLLIADRYGTDEA